MNEVNAALENPAVWNEPKRAQELGFTLDDAAELLSLSEAKNRKRLREITHSRVLDIRQRIAQLESMATALEGLADCCAKTSAKQSCPIIAALIEDSSTQGRPLEAVAAAG